MNADMTPEKILEFIKGCPSVDMGGYHVSGGIEYEWGIHQKGNEFYMVEWKNGVEPQTCIEVKKITPTFNRQFISFKQNVWEEVK